MSEIISLINEKGGVGKSSSAISIAQILAISGYSILLIDLDPQMNTSKMFGKNDEGNAKDYEQLFCKKLSKKSEVLDYISQTDYENISILCASRVLNSLIYKIYDESKESNVELCFKYNLALLKDDYDYIIIDNSPFKSYLTTCAMCASNKIITPICVDNFSYDGLMSLFDTIEELNQKYAREPFRWLYAILAILNLLTPIVLLVMAINNDLFRYGGGRMIAAFILVWLVIAFVSWLGFQIWWNRREKVYAAATAHDDFVAIPVFSHFIQTFGEWAGMFVGIGGALLTLIAAIFLNGDASMLRMMGTGAFFGSGSLIYIVLNPIYGFIIVVVTRAAAETFRALAAIANNTKKS